MAAGGEGRQDPPDGPRKSPLPSLRPSRGWVFFFLALLALNIFLSARAMNPASRVRIPYSPYFLDQVAADHVDEITSKGTAIQGTFTKPLSYQDAKATKLFRTEIPTFANTNALTALLREHKVTVNAQPLDTGAVWWKTLLFG